MDTNLAVQAVALKQMQTQQMAEIAVLKKAQDMQQQLVEMVKTVTQSAPPPGQGTVVDRSA